MGLFNAFYTSLSGLNANSHTISVTGNNIANMNTTGFKSSRAVFETEISQSLRAGSAPSGESGGTNPTEVGLGVRLSSVSRDFGAGALQLTGANTDLAIDGNGFFVVEVDGDTVYTRSGAFQRNRDSMLTTANGGLVQGYGIDDDFNVVEGVLQDISIPIGSLTLAEATTEASFTGNLNAAGDVAQNAAQIESAALYTDALATTLAQLADDLVNLFDGDGTALFSNGDVIHLTDLTRGGATVPEKTFEVGAANTTGSDGFGQTLEELLGFFEEILGIDTSVGGGVTLDSGKIVIEGNTGLLNDIDTVDSGIYVNEATGLTPFEFTKSQDADGESVRTRFEVYDSLGIGRIVDVTMVLEQTSDTGTTWRFYAHSEADSDLATILGSGTVAFDTDGQILAVTDETITMDLADTGSTTPQQITLTLDDPNLGLSSLADSTSQISMISQDGSSIGTLEDFAVQTDGTIVGQFSNGLLRNLGQVVLATFVNPRGLSEKSVSQFEATPSSGEAMIVAPGAGSSGRVIGQALELSNVDITEEFISLVAASTGFSANSRVFSTNNQLMQELLAAIR